MKGNCTVITYSVFISNVSLKNDSISYPKLSTIVNIKLGGKYYVRMQGSD